MPTVDDRLPDWKQALLGLWLLGVVAFYVRQVVMAWVAYISAH